MAISVLKRKWAAIIPAFSYMLIRGASILTCINISLSYNTVTIRSRNSQHSDDDIPVASKSAPQPSSEPEFKLAKMPPMPTRGMSHEDLIAQNLELRDLLE